MCFNINISIRADKLTKRIEELTKKTKDLSKEEQIKAFDKLMSDCLEKDIEFIYE